MVSQFNKEKLDKYFYRTKKAVIQNNIPKTKEYLTHLKFHVLSGGGEHQEQAKSIFLRIFDLIEKESQIKKQAESKNEQLLETVQQNQDAAKLNEQALKDKDESIRQKDLTIVQQQDANRILEARVSQLSSEAEQLRNKLQTDLEALENKLKAEHQVQVAKLKDGLKLTNQRMREATTLLDATRQGHGIEVEALTKRITDCAEELARVKENVIKLTGENAGLVSTNQVVNESIRKLGGLVESINQILLIVSQNLGAAIILIGQTKDASTELMRTIAEQRDQIAELVRTNTTQRDQITELDRTKKLADGQRDGAIRLAREAETRTTEANRLKGEALETARVANEAREKALDDARAAGLSKEQAEQRAIQAETQAREAIEAKNKAEQRTIEIEAQTRDQVAEATRLREQTEQRAIAIAERAREQVTEATRLKDEAVVQARDQVADATRLKEQAEQRANTTEAQARVQVTDATRLKEEAERNFLDADQLKRVAQQRATEALEQARKANEDKNTAEQIAREALAAKSRAEREKEAAEKTNTTLSRELAVANHDKGEILARERTALGTLEAQKQVNSRIRGKLAQAEFNIGEASTTMQAIANSNRKLTQDLGQAQLAKKEAESKLAEEAQLKNDAIAARIQAETDAQQVITQMQQLEAFIRQKLGA